MISSEESISGIKNLKSLDSLYFGIGICNRDSLSLGLPIDVLSMLLVSEEVAEQKHILIADSHANGNGFSEDKISKIANTTREILYRTLSRLGFDRWEIVLASEIDRSPDYQIILGKINEPNEYVRRELADIEWFRSRGVGLKLGWSLQGDRDSSETFFDRKYSELFGEEMSFLYVVPGATLDPKSSRAAPYFCKDEKNRILLSSDKQVEKLASAERRLEEMKNDLEKGPRMVEFNSDPFGKFMDERNACLEMQDCLNRYRNYMKKIVRLYERVISTLGEGPVKYKIQRMIEWCLD